MTTTDRLIESVIQGHGVGVPRITGWGKLVYFVMFASVMLLGATGIVGAYIWGSPLPLWLLMIHVSCAPMFAISLMLVSLTWADRCRFGEEPSRMRTSSKALLWIVLALGLIVILSGVVPMTPIFGTDGQHFLFYSHRYCAMALAAAVVLHLLSLIRLR